MSIENGARFLRRLRDDANLRAQVRRIGEEPFEAISAAAGASCSAAEVIAAIARELESERFHEPYHEG
ncbi:MAG: hypothetical protein ACR2PZ_07890 [Pseudomonadales bacterium]